MREKERESRVIRMNSEHSVSCEVYLGMHRTDTKLRAAQPRLYIIVNNG